MPCILFVNHVGIISGAEKVFLGVIDALRLRQYECVVACPENTLLAQEIARRGIPQDSIPSATLVTSTNPADWLRYLGVVLDWSRRIYRIVRKEKIDIIHANSFTAALLTTIPSRLAGIPLVWHMHDIIKPGRVNGFFLRLLGMNAQVVICVSWAVARNLMSFGIPLSKLQVIYNFAYGFFEASSLTREEARVHLGVSSEAILIGMVGQIARWKGQHVFVEAVHMLAAQKNLPEVSFFIIGDIISQHERQYRENLLKMIEQYELTSLIAITGFRDDVPHWMRAFDVLVHASIREDPSPVILGEGMVNGCCIVATNVGGVPETIEHGKSGLLVPPDDPLLLTNTLAELIQSPALRSRLVKGAQERFVRFDASAELDKLRHIYSSLTQRVSLDAW